MLLRPESFDPSVVIVLKADAQPAGPPNKLTTVGTTAPATSSAKAVPLLAC